MANDKKKAGDAHPGFAKVAEAIAAKQGIPLERAKAILGARSRGASEAARAKNPRLNNVK